MYSPAPPAIPAGKVAEFAAKLADPLPRPMKIEFIPTSGQAISTIIRPTAPALAITAIRFSGKLDTAYIYIEGNSDTPLVIKGVELDGEWVGGNLWLSSRSLVKGQKQLAIITLDPPLTQGQFLIARVLCENNVAAEERVRVFSGFPIGAEGAGTPPSGFGLDPAPYMRNPPYVEVANPEAKRSPVAAPSLRGNYVFSCAMHTFGLDKTRTAREILRRYDLCARFDPHHPSCQHLCRIRPETGYALFAETTDVLLMNPNITTGLSRGRGSEKPEDVVARITRYACLAARPRPVFGIAETVPFGKRDGLADPGEFRRRTYTMLGEGVKALLYRHGAWSATDPNAQAMDAEIKRLNAEVRPLRPYLDIADPVPCSKTNGPDGLLTYALFAGDKAAVLILIRQASSAPLPQGATARVAIPLPEALKPQGASLVTPGGLQPLPQPVAPAQGDAVAIDVPVPDAAAAYVIPLARKPQ